MAKANTEAPAAAPVAPAAPQSPATDEHVGMGGSYVIDNGVRRLVERTQTPADAGTNDEAN